MSGKCEKNKSENMHFPIPLYGNNKVKKPEIKQNSHSCDFLKEPCSRDASQNHKKS